MVTWILAAKYLVKMLKDCTIGVEGWVVLTCFNTGLCSGERRIAGPVDTYSSLGTFPYPLSEGEQSWGTPAREWCYVGQGERGQVLGRQTRQSHC